MKFIHIADMHFDSPFVNLSEKELLGDKRRLEQRKIFKKIIEYIKQEKIDNLFISGDLYEHKYIKQSTIEYINNLFKEIPETQIYIAPGNHDPYLKNSYYSKYKWNENVKIFQGKIEKIETQEADIYGYGFNDFYCTNSGIEEINIENRNKPQILIIHGTLNGANIEEKQYNSITTKQLEEIGFDYVALGHIHKPDYTNNKIVYPGSAVALGFDEPGEHGMVVGNIEKSADNETKIEIKFVPLDDEKFIKKEIDVTEINSKEELIEKINEIEIKNNEYIEIILIGKRNFEIKRIIKIKNKTKIAYDLKKLENETTLKGLFVKEILNRYGQNDQSEEEQEIIEKAIEIAFEALE